MNIRTLTKYKNDNLVKCQRHPTKDLFIWNYTELVQYNRLWDDITRRTRGLVTTSDGEIVAHSFRKFHNIEENLHTPTDTFTVYEKVDGSLGILFWYDNEWIMASRGSFTSDQANEAKQLLTNYDLQYLEKNLTYNFEIIYPENRIVVDYKGKRELVFLAAFDREGTEHDVEEQVAKCGFPIVTKYSYTDYQTIKELNWENHEGFIVKFSNGDRCKIKFHNYLELHRKVTNLNALRVWEMFKENTDISKSLDNIPDECFNWVSQKWNYYQNEFKRIETEALNTLADLKSKTTTRADFAKLASKHTYSRVIFNMYNGKEYRNIIIDLIRPINGIYDTPWISKEEAQPPQLPSKVIILVGISASGKSTWAHSYIQKNPNTVRVSRDDFRKLLFGYSESNMFQYYEHPDLKSREKVITELEMGLIDIILKQQKNIIIDNTNLKKEYITAYLKKLNRCEVQFKVFKPNIQECIERDSKRTSSVGREIIEKQYKRFEELIKNMQFTSREPQQFQQIEQDVSLPHCYVFDIDGTLANNTHRNPFDWNKVDTDSVFEDIKETLISHYKQGYPIVICTGRDLLCEERTKNWLDTNNILYHRLYMRKQGDRKPDWMVKEDMWKEICKDFYIVGIYDDRDSVVEHARRIGLRVFQVNYGDF